MVVLPVSEFVVCSRIQPLEAVPVSIKKAKPEILEGFAGFPDVDKSVSRREAFFDVRVAN